MRNEYCIEWVEKKQNSVSVRSIFHVIIINVTNQVANEPNIHKDLKKCHCNGMNQSCSKQQHIKMETGKYRIKGVKMTRNSLKSREANGFRGTNRSECWRRERKKNRNESIQELLLWFLLSSHFLSFSSNENVCYIWCLCVCTYMFTISFFNRYIYSKNAIYIDFIANDVYRSKQYLLKVGKKRQNSKCLKWKEALQ